MNDKLDRLSKMQKSISDMTDDELVAFHRQIRAERGSVVRRQEKTVKKERKAAGSKLDKITKSLTPEMRAMLVEALGKKK